jgi:hypothetical protein
MRNAPEGQIRQDKKIVGSICLPEVDAEDFIDQFNNCYGPLRLHIAPPPIRLTPGPKPIAPVGAARSIVTKPTFVFDASTHDKSRQ